MKKRKRKRQRDLSWRDLAFPESQHLQNQIGILSQRVTDLEQQLGRLDQMRSVLDAVKQKKLKRLLDAIERIIA